MESNTDPPEGQESRQATDTIGGFVYQAWQTVDAWLRLSPDEVLFVEHGEDFDVIEGDTLESVQIKEELGDLSLGRQEARDAIKNYWQLRNDNPEREVTYRHLTTQSRGNEQGSPFGEEKGLDVWEDAKRSVEKAEWLQEFLKQQSFSDDLKEFLETASLEKFQKEIVRPISWDTEASPDDEIKQIVKKRLIEHGQRQAAAIPAHVSERAADTFFSRVLEISAHESPRALDFAEFVRVFEAQTMEKVPGGTDLAQSARAARSVQPLRSKVGHSGFLEQVNGIELRNVVPRDDLVTEVKDRINGMLLSALIGSSGMGKSVLAELTAIGDDTSNWFKTDFLGLEPNEVANQIDEMTLALSEIPDGSNVILDDINFIERPDLYRNSVSRLLTAARQQSIHFLITSQNSVPFRIRELVEGGGTVNFSVPPFMESEIVDLVEKYECPEALQDVWGHVIWLHSSGHPLMAGAYALSLRRKGWPEPTPEEALRDPATIEDVKKDAQSKLRSYLSDEALQFVERLSALSRPFTKEQALRIGRIPPPLSSSKYDFNELVGPWIEPLLENRYRLSPLLSDLHQETLTDDKSDELYADVSDVLVEDIRSSSTVTGFEVANLLQSGLLGGNEGPLWFLIAILKERDDKELSRISSHIGWFSAVNTGDNFSPIVDENPDLSIALRWVQFLLAVDQDRAVQPVFEAWIQEMEDVDEQSRAAYHYLHLGATLAENVDVEISVRDLLLACDRIYELEATGSDSDVDIPSEFDLGEGEDAQTPNEISEEIAQRLNKTTSESEFALSILFNQIHKGENLTELVELALTNEFEINDVIIEALKEDISSVNAVASRVWTEAAGADQPNWGAVTDIFERLEEISLNRGLEALYVVSAKNRALVVFEYLNDRSAAEDILDEAHANLERVHPLLLDYQAKIRNKEGEYPQAVDLYDHVMRIWTDTGPLSPKTVAYHDAIYASGKSERWDKALQWSREGQQSVRSLTEEGQPYFELCYGADEAFVLYKLDNPCKAIQKLNEVISQFTKSTTDARVRLLYRRVTQIVVWIYEDLGGTKLSSMEEPEPGLASRFEEDHVGEEVDVLSPSVLNELLKDSASLQGCEQFIPEQSDLGDKFDSAAEKSLHAFQKVKEGIRCSTTDLPERAQKFAEATASSIDEKKGHDANSTTADEELIPHIMGVAILPALMNDPDFSLFEDWKKGLREVLSEGSSLESWLDTAEKAFAATDGKRRAFMSLVEKHRSVIDSLSERLVSSSSLIVCSRDPHSRLSAAAFYVGHAARFPFGQAAGEYIAAAFELDVKPSEGFAATAEMILDSDELPPQSLSKELEDLLRKIANGEMDWKEALRTIQESS